MYARLTDEETLKGYLAKVGITPSRQSGQNFLISDEVVEATVAALEGAPKHITELGAGTGVLTQALVLSGYTVKAIERDEKLIQILQSIIPPAQRGNVELVAKDLREAEWSWDTPYVLLGNIPYNLSGYISRHMTQLRPAPSRVIFLVQKEVGERMAGSVPDLSLLGLSVQLWGTPEIIMGVPASCFWPAPQVSSCLIHITPHEHLLAVEEQEKILGVAKLFFQGKRKQIGGHMQRTFNLSKEQVEALCAEVGITPMMRPQEVGVEQWKLLAAKLGNVHHESPHLH